MSATTDAARTALQQGDTAQAIQLLEQAITHTPEDYDAQTLLGMAYSQAGRNDEAVQTLTQAVTLQPSNPQARYNLGVAFERAGWKDHALAAMQQALMLKPDYAQARQMAARLQQELAPPPAPMMSPPPPQNAPLSGYGASYAPPNYSSPGYGASAPGGYSSNLPPHPTVPSQPPGTLPPPAYTSSYSGPKIGLATMAGLLMALVIGAVFGFIGVAAGFRIPYLHLAVGWLIGMGVKGAAGEGGDKQAVIAGACTLLSLGLGVGIMYLGNAYFSWFTGIIAVIAVVVSYRTAEG